MKDEKTAYRLVVTMDFDSAEDRQHWFDEHEYGRCTDIYDWNSVRLVSAVASDHGEEPCSIASACKLPDGHEGAHDYMLISEALGEAADATSAIQAAIDAASAARNTR